MLQILKILDASVRSRKVGAIAGGTFIEEQLRSQFPRLDLVYIAPDPRLARFNRANQRMVHLVEVLRRVLVLGRVAAPYLSARQAQAQMNPRIAGLHALFADVFIGCFNFDLIEMRALVFHGVSKTMSHYCQVTPVT